MEFTPNMIVRLVRLTCYSDNATSSSLMLKPVKVKEIRFCASCRKNHVYLDTIDGVSFDGDFDYDCFTKVNTLPIKKKSKKTETEMREELNNIIRQGG